MFVDDYIKRKERNEPEITVQEIDQLLSDEYSHGAVFLEKLAKYGDPSLVEYPIPL